MSLIDWEGVVHDLEAHVRSKNSHGQRELTDLLADLRVRHRQPEGLIEKVGRVYIQRFTEDLASGLPADPAHVGAGEMAESSPHPRSQNGSEGAASNGHRRSLNPS